VKTEPEKMRVYRGGSWRDYDPARSVSRAGDDMPGQAEDVGLRPVRDIPKEKR